MKIREQELIVYRNFEEYEAMPLHDMAWLMGAGQRGEEDCGQRANVMYRCMYSLLELAGNYGFYGNLWHCYLAHLLVNNETVTAGHARSGERWKGASLRRCSMISLYLRNYLILIFLIW